MLIFNCRFICIKALGVFRETTNCKLGLNVRVYKPKRCVACNSKNETKALLSKSSSGQVDAFLLCGASICPEDSCDSEQSSNVGAGYRS